MLLDTSIDLRQSEREGYNHKLLSVLEYASDIYAYLRQLEVKGSRDSMHFSVRTSLNFKSTPKFSLKLQ